MQVLLHQVHLGLVFEVRHGPDTADDHFRPDLAGVVDGEALEGGHADARLAAEHVAQHLDALGGAEGAALVEVHGHGDDNLLEDPQRPLGDVEMPVRERVEAGREQRQSALVSLLRHASAGPPGSCSAHGAESLVITVSP